MFPTLLEARKEPKNEYKLGQFVRIKKGLYNGDLAKIYKIKKNTTDLVLVPRINLQEIHSKMK
jgi:transcription antitermination factor NusG